MEYINWEKLSAGAKQDIAENIHDNNDYLKNINIWTFLDDLNNELNFEIPIIKLKVNNAKSEVLKNGKYQKKI